MSAPADARWAIDVHGLNKRFGDKHVVNDLSMQVGRGEIFGFLGPNGSGKTTSIRMMCGLLTPDSGSGTCLGYDIVKQSGEIKRRVGYMTQRFSFWEDLSIRENLDFVARMYEHAVAPRGGRPGDRRPRSGGRARRSSPARCPAAGSSASRSPPACCTSPNCCCSTSRPPASTPGARRDFWEELHALAARGISVLVSTHYMDEAERCHKLAYIAYGRLMAQGTAEEIIASQGLTTWEVTGGDLTAVAERLRGRAGRRAGRRLRLRAARDRPRRRRRCEAALREAVAGTDSRVAACARPASRTCSST